MSYHYYKIDSVLITTYHYLLIRYYNTTEDKTSIHNKSTIQVN